MTDMQPPTADLDAVKAKQQTVWASGDYAILGTTLQITGEQLCETLDLRAGAKVLDVAAGNGNATLAAARRFARVTSTDYVPALLERARERAEAERLEIAFQPADAEALPFDDAAFDYVLSTFGVMFTPNQALAASELARVCRPGGKIGMANWTADGFVGRLFKVIGTHLPPPPGVRPPSNWGDPAMLESWFGDLGRVSTTPRSFAFRYLSPDHFIEVSRAYYGPVHKAFAAVGDAAPALEADMRDLLAEFNRATDGSLVVPSAYVDVVIERT